MLPGGFQVVEFSDGISERFQIGGIFTFIFDVIVYIVYLPFRLLNAIFQALGIIVSITVS